jgi:L-ribulose-5-phosphate 4-epimerase
MLREGLIYRTWGNFSIRISQNSFLITPSGLNYQQITPSDLVELSIYNGRYKGLNSPSSEREVHRIFYQQNPNINAVFHTHQIMASILASRGRDFLPAQQWHGNLGQVVPCCAYAPSGSAKMSRNIKKILRKTTPKALLLANHGAVICGINVEEALKRTRLLEQACEEYIARQASAFSEGRVENAQERLEYFKKKYPRRRTP